MARVRLRAGQRSVGQRARRLRAPGHDQPPRPRRRLERPAPGRRPPGGQRGQPPRQPLVREAGVTTMRVLTISGSLRPDSYNALLLRAVEEQAPADVELAAFEGL